MIRLAPACLRKDEIGLKCYCGLVFTADKFDSFGRCPECQVADALSGNDSAPPDRASVNFDESPEIDQ